MFEPRSQREPQINLEEAPRILEEFLSLYRQYIVAMFDVDSARNLPYVYRKEKDGRRITENIDLSKADEKRIRVLSEIKEMRRTQPWLKDAEEYVNNVREIRILEEKLRGLEEELYRVKEIEDKEGSEVIELTGMGEPQEKPQIKKLEREIKEVRQKLDQLRARINNLAENLPEELRGRLDQEGLGIVFDWDNECVPYLEAVERGDKERIESMEKENPYLRFLQYYRFAWLEIRYYQKENRQPEEYAYFVDRIEQISTYFSPEIKRRLEDYLKEKYSKTQ